MPFHQADTLVRIAQGDRSAMRECVARYGSLIWSMARTFTTSAADADDATQDVFVHVWQRASAFDPQRGNEVQFISVIARRRLIDWVRKHARTAHHTPMSPEAIDALLAHPPGAPGDASMQDVQADRAWAALRTLLPEQQQVLVLSIVQGLTHEQISRHLGMPLGTVKTTLYRGLALIREELASQRNASSADGPTAVSRAATTSVTSPSPSKWGTP
jgi:RNA polymerase sigma factor (sigma-70 family)